MSRNLRVRTLCFVVALASLPIAAVNAERWTLLVGSEKGIHAIDAEGKAAPLWTDGEARKILRSGDRWFALTSRGILSTRDLAGWEGKNDGLPVKVLKKFDGGRKSFERVVQELKDLEANPADPNMLVTATKDSVFLSKNGGETWKSLGMPRRTNGIKAVAVASLEGTIVFVSHGIYGVQYLEVDKQGAKWTDLNSGLEKLETTGNPDEVSDIAVAPAAGAASEVYAAQTFKGRIYRLDWKAKSFIPLWSDGAEFGTVEALACGPGLLRFVRRGEIDELRLGTGSGGTPPSAPTNRTDLAYLVERAAQATGAQAICVSSEGLAPSPEKGPLALSELWLLGNGRGTDAKRSAAGHEGLYIPANHAADPKLLAPYLSIIEKRGLDMAVVDMKDDYGRLRFTPRDSSIASKGRVFNPIDLESFVSTMKGRGVWLVARVVVFKDPELAKKEGGKYAVWDAKEDASWVGYTETRRKKAPAETDAASTSGSQAAPGSTAQGSAPSSLASAEDEYETVRIPRDERWVDPYAEDIWEYIAVLSRELVSRGFDEIQFDYIRFPTDGDNLEDARYRWKDAGMDMESAILSFLNHVRGRIDAPLSVDIYGANGWYRTGARTGQEVELISRYVDVICPMYYPSHFEQEFLAEDPAELRPYRIYYRGTLRTQLIARDRVVVRPYAQSFYLNVAYDRKYYGEDYVRRELEGVRDAGSNGLTYWNNVGRYDEIPVPTDERSAANTLGKEKAALD